MALLPLNALRSIGQSNSNDYFAMLGLPVMANNWQIRQRYLCIARNLHPDIYGRTVEEKQKACDYLAKLVSPAYNILMQERERAEYAALLKLIAKRLMKRELKLTPKSAAARNLLASPSMLHYIISVEAIAKLQYQSLDRILEYTDQLTELNLIYTMYQEGYHPSLFGSSDDISCTINLPSMPPQVFEMSAMLAAPQPLAKNQHIANQQLPQDNPQPDISSRSPHRAQGYLQLMEGFINQNPVDAPDLISERSQNYLQIAECYIEQQQWMMAWEALHTALHLDNTNSKCHALLGLVYLNQNLIGMAKVSFRHSLKINPKEPLALKYITRCTIPKLNSLYTYIKRNGFFGWLGSS
jgi:DnaJ domain